MQRDLDHNRNPVFADESAVMQRGLELARTALGRVEPNPCVGAVIVDSQLRELGAGCHEFFGGPHAEVMALRAAGSSAQGATLFVTLEPCHHQGKTPPCTQAVIAAGIRRVVIATHDPADHDHSSGIQELQEAGIDVSIGLCADEARQLIAPFEMLMNQHRPYIHAKWAMTLDGKLATRTGHSKWISNEKSRAKVHALRGRMDAIITGIGTVMADDPLLTARPAGQRIPVRIVLDSHSRLPLNSQLVRTLSESPVLLVTTSHADVKSLQALEKAGVEVLICDSPAESPRCNLPDLLREVGQRQMTNVLLEAGSEVLGAFHDLHFIDEVHCFIAPKLAGGADAQSPFAGIGTEQIPQQADLIRPHIEIIDEDIYMHGPVRRG